MMEYKVGASSGSAGERNDIAAIKNIQAGLLKELSENLRMDATTRAKKQAQLDQTYVDLARLGGAADPGDSSNTGAPLPANASAKNLVVGTVYQTAKGPAKWTGTGFMPI
jgi:hypothetical protein